MENSENVPKQQFLIHFLGLFKATPFSYEVTSLTTHVYKHLKEMEEKHRIVYP